MKRKSLATVIICLIGAMLLIGCGKSKSSEIDLKDKLKDVKEEAKEGDAEEKKPEEKKDNTKEEATKEDIEITDVSWNFGSYEEFSEGNSDVAEVYFKLSNGDTVTKQVPLGTYVEGKEEIDIDGDGKDEIVIHQYFSNNITEYDVVYIYKLVDGNIEEIFPTEDIPEIMTDVADTRIKPLDKEGYPKYMLDVTTYGKDGADVSVKYHASLAWNKGAWEEIESDDESGDAYAASTISEQESFFGLWVGAYKEREDAEKLVTQLEDKGLPASYVYSCDWENLNKDPYYCVTIGRSGSEPEAQAYIEDAKQAGYPKAYVKYTGEKLGHRVNFMVFDESKIDISFSKAVLKDVTLDDLSGDNTGEVTLIVDKDTVFDESCDLNDFVFYVKGDTPIDWFNNASKHEDEHPDDGPAFLGGYEVSITGNHIDRFYSSYWWD